MKADRPQLAKLMKALQPGDVVIVTKLDRLGRSTRELLNLLHQIDEAGAAFKSLGDPLFDTIPCRTGQRVIWNAMALSDEFAPWGAASVLPLFTYSAAASALRGTAPWSASAVFKLMPTSKPADRDLPKNGER